MQKHRREAILISFLNEKISVVIFKLYMVKKGLKLRTNLICQTETQEQNSNVPGAHRITMRS